MDLKLLSGLLLVAQIASLIFIVLVLIRQYSLFKTHIQEDLVVVRRTLFWLALVIFAGNIISLTLNVLTVTGMVGRSVEQINLVGVAYSVSNTLTLLFSALLIWLLYRMAQKVLVIVEHAKDVALDAKNGVQ